MKRRLCWFVAVAVVIAPLAYLSTKRIFTDVKAKRLWTNLQTTDPKLLESALYGLRFKTIPEGKTRDNIEQKVILLLASTNLAVKRAAITACDTEPSGLGLIRNENKALIVRKAMEDYNAASPFSRCFLLEQEDNVFINWSASVPALCSTQAQSSEE